MEYILKILLPTLYVMCQATRYLGAYPLHSVSAKVAVKAPRQFISILKVIQSGQGSNFTF